MKEAAGYQVEDLRIDTRTRRVTRAGEELDISGLTYDLLIALVRAAPNLLSAEELLERVWPGVIVSPETLTQRVKLLRQAIADSADQPRYVAAVRGHGYRLLPVVVPLPESALTQPSMGVSPPALAADPAPSAQSPRPLHRRIWLPVTGLAVLCGLALLVWLAGRSPPGRPRGNAISVAVMPFANLTGEPAKDYLGDGMAEELINALAQVPGLKVPARTSTFAYKGHESDIRRIAQDLGVATVLEGSVRSAGERLRISARLVDASNGFQVWSQDYDRDSRDIFKLQDELAGQIVDALRTRLNVALPAAPPRHPPTQDVNAYDLYLQAKAAANGSVDSFLRGIALDDQALARDPAFARALSDRADHRMSLVAVGHPLPEGLDYAERDVRQALKLDSQLAAAYAVLGAINALRQNWTQAEESFRAAVAADPSDGYIRAQHAAFVLASTGQIQAAYAEAQQAYHLAPAHGFCSVVLMIVNSLRGDDASAARFADLAIQHGAAPAQFAPFYAALDVHQGHFAEAGARVAAALAPRVRAAGGAEAVTFAYLAIGDPGKRPQARRQLVELTQKLPAADLDYLDGPQLMYLLDQLDARAAAFDLVERGNGPLAGNGWELLFWRPAMRSFRADPRFVELVRGLHFFDFWMRFGPPDACALQGGQLSCPP